MSWLDDLVEAGSAIADKVIDYNIAEASIDAGIIPSANAAESNTAVPIGEVETTPLAPPSNFRDWLPWIAAGGAALVVVYMIARG